MAYHHSNRAIEHPENPILTALSHYEARVLIVITHKMNLKDPLQMRFSASYIAELTQSSQNNAQKALVALVAKGALVTIGNRRARQGYAYALSPALDCPADCGKLNEHYTPLELSKRRGERLTKPPKETGLETDLAPSSYPLLEVSSEPNTPSSYPLLGVTNKELINNLNKQSITETETLTDSQQVAITIDDFLKVLSSYKPANGLVDETRALIANDPKAAHQVFLGILEQSGARGNRVANPKAYLARIYAQDPGSLLASSKASENPGGGFEAALSDRLAQLGQSRHLLAGLTSPVMAQLRAKYEQNALAGYSGAVGVDNTLLREALDEAKSSPLPLAL